MKYWLALFSLAMIVVSGSFSYRQQDEKPLRDWYSHHVDTLAENVALLQEAIARKDTAGLKALLENCRMAYKPVEMFVAYYYPLTEQRFNGPDVEEVDTSDYSEVDYPSGFQVMEDIIYDKPRYKWPELKKQADILVMLTALLKKNAVAFDVSDSELLDILRTGMYDLASKGLSGFDTPESGYSLKEGGKVMAEIWAVLKLRGLMTAALSDNLNECADYLNRYGDDFNGFDRARFLSQPFRKAMASLYRMQQDRKIPFPSARGAVKKDVESFYSKNAFDPYFFAPDSVKKPSGAVVALGQKLFNEKGLSMEGRSCAGCHQPDKDFTDGMIKNKSLQKDITLLRNTPTLWNVSLQPVLFYDGRQTSLEGQAHDVLQNRDEMDARLKPFIARISADAHYSQLFRKAFPGHAGITGKDIIAAITAYERTLLSFNAPYDRFMRGDAGALSRDQQAGFNLFMGKALCGTCHYNPLFNGTVPPFYTRADLEVIGVPQKVTYAGTFDVDSDPGGFDFTHNTVQQHAFKTPTLRNLKKTGPYMHNGVYPTLEAVIDFYDRGGGKGLGIKLRNQTLAEAPLHLTATEKKQLLSFLESLNNNN